MFLLALFNADPPPRGNKTYLSAFMFYPLYVTQGQLFGHTTTDPPFYVHFMDMTKTE